MNIHVVSSLTSEDEDLVADALLWALAELLNGLPIAYALRIETTGARILQRTNLETLETAGTLGPHPHAIQ